MSMIKMRINDLKSEIFSDDTSRYIRKEYEIPYLLAIQSIMEYDRKVAKRAKRLNKIKSFFLKIYGATLGRISKTALRVWIFSIYVCIYWITFCWFALEYLL